MKLYPQNQQSPQPKDQIEQTTPFSQKNNQHYSNQIFIQERTQSQTIYYVPAYLRMKLKNINIINLSQLNGQLNTTIILTVYYGTLPEQIIEALTENIVFQFARNPSIKLQPSLQITFKDKPKDKYFTYTIRKMIDVRLYGQVFLTPFQIISLVLSIGVRSVSLQYKGKNVEVRFNLMDHPNNSLKISYSQETKFGYYELAPGRLIAEYSPQPFSSYQRNLMKEIGVKMQKEKRKTLKQYQKYRKNNTEFKQIQQGSAIKQQQASEIQLAVYEQAERMITQTIRNIQYAHFVVPLYKRPGVTIVTVFFPLIILGLINLGIFFQDQRLGKRFLNISALMIAYAALIPTVRQTIPPGPTVTLVEFLVYLQSFTTLICLIESVIERNNENIAVQFTDSWQTNPYLMLSLAITVLVFLTVAILYFVHKLLWQRNYLNVNQNEVKQKFNRKKWGHKFADYYFKRFDDKIISYENLIR